MNYKINKASKIPLYYQLNEYILRDIKNGIYKPGDYIPTEEELCNTLGISRGTVRQAINLLVDEGFLERIRGKGSLVKAPSLNHDLLGDFSFGQGIERQGMKRSVILVSSEVTEQKHSIRSRLNLAKGSKIIKIRRIHCANEEPWILEDSYLDYEKFKGLEDLDFTIDHITTILPRRYDTKLHRIEAFVEPTLVDEERAQLFNMKPGIPALSMDRVLLDESDTPIIYSHAFVRGDRCRYYFNIKSNV